MKKTLLIALFTTLYFSSFGQKIRFTDSTNTWTVFNYFCGGDPIVDSSIFRYINDTIIHDTLYRQLYDRYQNNAFIREDTLLHKVFAISHIHDTDTSEYVLYDYTLQLNDTLNGKYSTQYVSAKDSVIINGVTHKTWHLTQAFPHSPTYPFVDYDVVEGIGCMSGPIYPYYPFFFEDCIQLTCFSTDGTTPPLSQMVGPYFDNSSSCSLTFGLAVNSIPNKTKNTTLFPNPIDETSKIILPYNISSGTLAIINDVGQTVMNTAIQNKKEVLIGDKIVAPGIYYYRITDNGNGKAFSGKFVSQ